MAQKIPGIYVEIKGDATQLKKEMAQAKEYIASQATGISNSLNNALSSSKISSSVNGIVQQLGTLNRAMKVDPSAFGTARVDLKDLTKLTDLSAQQFGKLQSRMMQTQAANAQESALRRIASACNLTEKEVRELGAQFGLSSGQINKVVGASKNAESSILSMGNVARTAFAYFSVHAVAGAVSSLISTADAYTLIENRLRLVSKESGNLKNIEEALYASANRVRTSYESQADLYIRTARSMADYNLTQQQTLAYSEAIAQSMVISGARVQEAESFAIQFSQAMQKGNLNDDEFKAVMESNGRAVKVLTDYLTYMNNGVKVTAGELRQLSTDGKITADVLYNAFSYSSDQLKKEMGSMVMTVGQANTHFKNAFGSLVSGTNDATGASGGLARSIDSLAVTVETNKDGIISLFTGVADAAGWSVERVANLVNSIKGMAAVAAGSLDFTDFAMMGPKDLTQWMSDYDNGLSSVREKITQLRDEQSKLFSAGLSDEDAIVKQYSQDILNLESQLAAKRSALAQKKQDSTKFSSMGTVSKINTGGDAKKQAEEAGEAFQQAFGTIGATTIGTYNAMAAAYERDRVAFIKATGDKETAQKVFDQKMGELWDSFTGNDKGTKGAALKAERSELKQLNAEVKNYADVAKDASKSADDWLRLSQEASAKVASMIDQYATAGMGEFAAGAYEQGKALVEAQKALDAYSGALETVDAKLADTTDAYQLASSQLEEMRSKLSSNKAGTGVEDVNKLKTQSEVVADLAENVKKLSQEKEILEGKKGGASNLMANLNKSFDVGRLKSAYGQIGAFTADIYGVLKDEYKADAAAFEAATGNKVAAMEMLKRNLAELDLSSPSISWARSVEIGLDRVAALSDATGENIAAAIEEGFSSASDALAEFVTTGELDFSNFTDAIIKDLARMAIQTQITTPIASALSGLFSSVGSGTVSADVSSLIATSGLFHTGGVVGSEGGERAVSSSLFTSAPRYHTGLQGNEFPAILKKGESVLTEGQMAAIGKGLNSSGKSQPNVNVIINNAPEGTTATVQQSSDGMNIDVVVEMVKQRLQDGIDRGRAPIQKNRAWL